VENLVSRWKGKEREIIASESARRINGETVVILTDITRQKEHENEAEFYNSVLRHDIFNKNEIALGYMGLLEKTNLTKKQRELIEKIKEKDLDIRRLRLTAICTVCNRAFLKEINDMNSLIKEIGPPSLS